ncbi:MAG: nitrilase-related carbon-nitrogen hydrolase [Desulfurococcaceae archaeon]
MSKLTVGLVQASFTASPSENSEKAYSVIKRNYREADIIVLPEYSMSNPFILKEPARVYEISEFLANSRYLAFFAKLADNLGTNIVVHLIERTERPPLAKNTTVLVTGRGEVLPLYSKLHLVESANYREVDFFEPGKSISKIISLNNFEIGFAICHDLRFPELFRVYANLGVKLVIVQAAWIKGPLKEEILDKLASSRSHENALYLIVANQVGEMFTGRSGVFNPLGYRELDMGNGEKYSEHTLFLEEVERARSTMPILRQAFEKWEVKIKQA